MENQIQEIPDYNKMYNTSSYSSEHPLHPLHPLHPHATASDTQIDYGPLDSGCGMTSATTNQSNNNNTNDNINMAPFQAPNASSSTVQQDGIAPTKVNNNGRRSSISDFFNKRIIGVDTSQQIPLKKTVSQPIASSGNQSGRRRSSIARMLRPNSQSNDHTSGDKLGRRRSSAFTSLGYKSDGGNEHKGPYAHVSRSQAEYMERIREAEKNLKLTHNVDGLPLPKEDNVMQAGGRRRSSLAKILGFDKPLLAR
ncbi:hypothetical protein BGX33_012460 [Mortierella sp. NVP41]|nr:hypothetical protein BGX33_012460 [Mortierella sp. NVP41]